MEKLVLFAILLGLLLVASNEVVTLGAVTVGVLFGAVKLLGIAPK